MALRAGAAEASATEGGQATHRKLVQPAPEVGKWMLGKNPSTAFDCVWSMGAPESHLRGTGRETGCASHAGADIPGACKRMLESPLDRALIVFGVWEGRRVSDYSTATYDHSCDGATA